MGRMAVSLTLKRLAVKDPVKAIFVVEWLLRLLWERSRRTLVNLSTLRPLSFQSNQGQTKDGGLVFITFTVEGPLKKLLENKFHTSSGNKCDIKVGQAKGVWRMPRAASTCICWVWLWSRCNYVRNLTWQTFLACPMCILFKILPGNQSLVYYF